MAKVIEVGNKLTLILSSLEKIGSFHGNISIDKSQVLSIEESPDPWNRSILRGIRAPGTGIPFVIMLGTLRHRQGKDFAAVYKRGPARIYNLKDSPYKRWIISIC
jgi:hypothetical protein